VPRRSTTDDGATVDASSLGRFARASDTRPRYAIERSGRATVDGARASGVSSIPCGETGGKITWTDVAVVSDIARDDDDDDDARRRRRWMSTIERSIDRWARVG